MRLLVMLLVFIHRHGGKHRYQHRYRQPSLTCRGHHHCHRLPTTTPTTAATTQTTCCNMPCRAAGKRPKPHVQLWHGASRVSDFAEGIAVSAACCAFDLGRRCTAGSHACNAGWLLKQDADDDG